MKTGYKIIPLLTAVLCSQVALSQITLTSPENTPEAEYYYIYDIVKMDYLQAVPGGADTVWQFTTIPESPYKDSTYYTANHSFDSFHGVDFQPPYTYPPDPNDTTLLFSDLAIYRVSDTMYYQAYGIVGPIPYVTSGEMAGGKYDPLLPFPSYYGMDKTLQNYISSGQVGQPTLEKWIKADGYGTLIVNGVTYSNVLRLHTYRYYYVQTASHAGNGNKYNIYEWYQDSSDVPVFRVRFSEAWGYNMGPATYAYDTTAFFYDTRVYFRYTGLPEMSVSQANVSIFPNPAGDFVTIESDKPIGAVELFDVTGNLVRTVDFSLSPIGTMSLIGLEKGIYILKRNSFSIRLIKD